MKHNVYLPNLQKLSTCNLFVSILSLQALLGNRYGFQPFPAKIGYEEFELLLHLAEELELEGCNLLTEWFIKDENAVPPEYVLQVCNQLYDSLMYGTDFLI